jgi:hypothetical protein
MPYVFTEISEETGSWLRDFQVLDISIVPKNALPVLIKNFRSSEYAKILDGLGIETKKVVLRKTSMVEDYVSYQIHTNRELDLMLRKMKPFAVFSKVVGEVAPIFNGQKFNKFAGVIKSKHVVVDGVSYYFMCRGGEEWRVKSYLVLQKVRGYLKNSVEMEAIEGELLGYSEEQNLEFARNFLSKYMQR